MDVLLVTEMLAAAVPPNVTVAPAEKPVPAIATGVPPEPGPLDGDTDDTVGAGAAAVYVKPPVKVPFWLSVLVTTTSTEPAACDGVVAEIEVLLLMTTPVAADPPNDTAAPGWKPVPVIVTAVPP